MSIYPYGSPAKTFQHEYEISTTNTESRANQEAKYHQYKLSITHYHFLFINILK